MIKPSEPASTPLFRQKPGGLSRVRSVMQRWLDLGLDLVYPPHCVHCKRTGALLCTSCESLIQTPPLAADSLLPLSGQRATAVFDGPIQSAIHAFKYQHNTRIADLLARRLADTLRTSGWSATLITAVPLHADRLRERGYNQSALLAERLAVWAALPFRESAVSRVRATRPQVGLNARDRQANVATAFQADHALVDDQAIVIIDDVYTTGATLRACAAALRTAGARDVWALTVASAPLRDAALPSP